MIRGWDSVGGSQKRAQLTKDQELKFVQKTKSVVEAEQASKKYEDFFSNFVTFSENFNFK